MKRSHSSTEPSSLPVLTQQDPRRLKSTLEGNYELLVCKIVDISKPTAKPVDEIDEPENLDIARENRLNQNSARMLQLTLKDGNNTEIFSIETEKISELDNIRENWTICLRGPVEIRCGNIMLERKHVIGKEQPSSSQILRANAITQAIATAYPTCPQPPSADSQDEVEIVVVQPPVTRPAAVQSRGHVPIPIIQMAEDWDDWDEDEDDDCIILD